MKRSILKHCIILYFLVIVITLQNAQAQQNRHFGVKGGLTLSTLSNQDFGHIKPGFQVGGFAKFGGDESLFFKAELLATQKGTWNWDRTNPSNLSLYYVDVPIMFGVDLARGFSLNFGIQPSVLVAGTFRSSFEGNIFTQSLNNQITRFDYSLLMGSEFAFKEDWLIGVRFNYGFVPIQGYTGFLTFKQQDQLHSNRVLQFYLGYVLR